MAPSLRALLTAFVLHCGLSCLAQSNVNSSPALPSSAPLTGNTVAGATYTLILQIGFGPRSFRIMRGEYRTDAAGQVIPWVDFSHGGPSGKPHRFTRVIFGSVSLTLPLPPLAAGVVGITLFLLVGYFLFARAVRGKTAEPRPQDTGAIHSK